MKLTRKHIVHRLVLGLAVVIASIGFTTAPAFAKSFAIPTFQVNAVLNPDASMDVVERITYVFDGEFHNGTRPIPAGDYDITGMKVTENDQPVLFDGAPNNLAWHFTANGGTHTYVVRYHVARAAKVGPDVGEIYWKWMGTDHSDIGHFNAQLRMPGTTDVKAWGHGPLNGNVAIAKDVITYDVSPLPASTFLEARATVPAASFTAAPSGDARLPGILTQEQRNADEANATRFSNKPEPDHSNLILGFNILAGLATIGACVAFFFIWSRWGRDPKRPADIGEYWYDAPDVAPATVVATVKKGDAFAGTLVDLAQRGYMRIEEIEDNSGLMHKIFGAGRDWKFTKLKARDESLLPFENRLLHYIFEEGDETTQGALHDRAQSHQTEARSFFSSFTSEVKTSVDGTYWKTNTVLVKVLNSMMAIALGFLGFVAIANKAYAGGACLIAAVALLALNVTLSCRTELGAHKAAEWEGLRNYLRDFGNFKDAPVGHLVLWERYLVYATALGVASQLAKGLELRAPELANDSNFAAWYVVSGGGHDIGRVAGLSTFSNGVTSAFSPPSQSSSGSGTGGGFSGGGGGGGGGGGVGAN